MFLKDLLFPKFCLGCGYLGSYICRKCQKNLYYVKNDTCLYCGRASLYGFTHPGCKRIKGIDGAMSIFYYNNLLKTIIKSIKYRFATEVWNEFRLVIKPEKLLKLDMYSSLAKTPFFIEAIPLHSNRLRLRGFNQAKLVAHFFNQFLQGSISEYLVRIKDTPSQARLEKPGLRYSNIRGAFEVKTPEQIKNKKFIIIDDVMTSGSTLKEAASVLKTHGATQIFALTIAHG